MHANGKGGGSHAATVGQMLQGLDEPMNGRMRPEVLFDVASLHEASREHCATMHPHFFGTYTRHDLLTNGAKERKKQKIYSSTTFTLAYMFHASIMRDAPVMQVHVPRAASESLPGSRAAAAVPEDAYAKEGAACHAQRACTACSPSFVRRCGTRPESSQSWRPPEPIHLAPNTSPSQDTCTVISARMNAPVACVDVAACWPLGGLMVPKLEQATLQPFTCTCPEVSAAWSAEAPKRGKVTIQGPHVVNDARGSDQTATVPLCSCWQLAIVLSAHQGFTAVVAQ